MENTGFMDNTSFKKKRMLNTEGTKLSANGFNGVIGLLLAFGLGINALMAIFLPPLVAGLNPWIVLGTYLVGSIASTLVIHHAKTAVVSFAGFTGLACSTGFLLSSFLVGFSGATIYTAFLSTGIIVVSMMLLSTIFPKFFLGLGRVLIFALLGSLLVEFVAGLIFGLNLVYMDYIVVVVFAGFIGFDWAKAQMYPKTAKNAIECSADIFMDIIVIFMRLVSIFGKKD